MKGRYGTYRGLLIGLVPSFLVVLVWGIFLTQGHSGGLDWGDTGSGGDSGSCAPDDPLVIVPGPLGSPVRIVALDGQTHLVADYSRRSIYLAGPEQEPTPFLSSPGRPLSVAVNASFRKKGLKEAWYFVGNDDAKSIDVYHEKKSPQLVAQLFGGDNAIQALDMAFVPELGQLFVVDGLAREVKVLHPDGQLVAVYGGNGALSDPKGLAVDAATGELFVSDYGDPAVGIPASIKVYSLYGSAPRSIPGSFSRPQGMALSTGKLYVADNMLAQILEFDRASGALTASYGCRGSSEGHLLLPMDVALDADGASLHVADNRNMRVTLLPLAAP